MESIASSSPRREALSHYMLVAAVAALMMTWNLDRTPLNGHEAYVAVVARNMTQPDHWLDAELVSGSIPVNNTLNHWMVPVFNGQARLEKPPLAYWCLAVPAKLGMPLNDFTTRLPSAIFAVLLAVVTLALGRAMLSSRAALLGTLMFTTSLGVIGWGRSARSDIQMTFWMSLAMFLFYLAAHDERPRRHLLLLLAWTAIALGNMAKQFVPLFLALPVLLYLAWQQSAACEGERRSSRKFLSWYLVSASIAFVICILVRITPALHWWRAVGLSDTLGIAVTVALTLGLPAGWYALQCRLWRRLPPFLVTVLPGVLIVAVLFVPWMLHLAHAFPQTEDVLSHQTMERGLGTGGWLERSASPLRGYYVQALAKWTLPWIVFFPGALALPFMKRFQKFHEGLVFLFLWIFGLVLLFSVAVGKHDQYILPALPAACLLMGCFAEDAFFEHKWVSIRFVRFFIVAAAVVMSLCVYGGLIGIFLSPGFFKLRVVHILIVAICAALPLWGSWLSLRKGVLQWAMAFLFVAVFLGELSFLTREDIWTYKWNALERMAVSLQVERDAERIRVASWRKPDAALVWYFADEVPVATQLRDLWIERHGEDVGKAKWKEWLGASPSLDIVTRLDEADEMVALGFQPDNDRVHNIFNWLRVYRRPPESGRL